MNTNLPPRWNSVSFGAGYSWAMIVAGLLVASGAKAWHIVTVGVLSLALDVARFVWRYRRAGSA